MRFYSQFIIDMLPHSIVLNAARVIFVPSRVINEISKKQSYRLTRPSAFVIAVTFIMLLSLQFALKPDSSREWTRAVAGLKKEYLDRFQKCFKIDVDIDMASELLKARWTPETSVLSDDIRDTVGSLEVESILIFVASCDKTLADKMWEQNKNATSLDWFILNILLPFEILATILGFSVVLHFLAKPHSKLFSTSLSFGCYFLGTFFLFLVLSGSLSLWNPLFWFSFFAVCFLFYLWLIRGIMNLDGRKYGAAIWIFNGSIFSSAIVLYFIGKSIIWFVKLIIV